MDVGEKLKPDEVGPSDKGRSSNLMPRQLPKSTWQIGKELYQRRPPALAHVYTDTNTYPHTHTSPLLIDDQSVRDLFSQALLPDLARRRIMTRSRQLVPNIRLKKPYVCFSCQLTLSAPAAQFPRFQQKRWITRNHINRIKEAMEDWNTRAKAIKRGEKQSMLSLLEERGFVNQIVGTRDDLDNLLTQRRVGVYCGVDPTAPSLHIGHLVPLMALGWFYIHGYSSVFLLGGTTARIGDPTDRLTSRQILSGSVRKANIANIHMQLKRLGAHIERCAARKGYAREWAWRRTVANNNTWFNKLPVAEFMRLLGSGIRMGPLLGREAVKNRLQTGHGIPFDEFAYPLMQAWDWWELFQKGAQVQIGGADQFGNILTGVEVIKAIKKIQPVHFEDDAQFKSQLDDSSGISPSKSAKDNGNLNEPIGFTVPLLTTSAGAKFGKSEGNAIWIDTAMTSSFDQYQFFLRSADADVEKYLKLFTFLSISEIQAIMEEHRLDESKRIAQHRVAFEFIELMHGLGEAEKAQQLHGKLFKGEISLDSIRAEQSLAPYHAQIKKEETDKLGDWNSSLNPHAQATSSESSSSVRLTLPRSLVIGQHISKVLRYAGLVSSKSEGFRLIASKGCHVGSKIGRGATTTTMGDSLAFTPATSPAADAGNYVIDGDLLILRVGKWKMKVITLVSDEEYERLGLTCPGWKEAEEDDVEEDGRPPPPSRRARGGNKAELSKAGAGEEARLFRRTSARE